LARKASNGPHHAADGVLQKLDLFRQLRIRRDQRPADDVGMAVQILGRRMHDDIGPQREGLLTERCGEGVVDDQQNVPRFGERRQGGDICQLHHRIGGGLDPQHLGLRRDGGLDGGEIAQIDIGKVQPHRAAPNALEQTP
jgi:hypothetical protein